uniref:Uncharacterized protein n=1 Tax=Anguilla anguilla TaxID=7936 RepID=A0A0E9SA63_ANGAN
MSFFFLKGMTNLSLEYLVYTDIPLLVPKRGPRQGSHIVLP